MLDLIWGCLEIVLFIDVRLLAVILGYMAIFCAKWHSYMNFYAMEDLSQRTELKTDL
jgi:hypothetical protein